MPRLDRTVKRDGRTNADHNNWQYNNKIFISRIVDIRSPH